MIRGIGTDIVEISRIRDAVEKWGEHFLNRVFTEKEIAYCRMRKDPCPCLAARFAAKEAMIKASGARLVFRDIEIGNRPDGKPFITINGPLLNASLKSGAMKVHLTVSHERNNAIATVILETTA